MSPNGRCKLCEVCRALRPFKPQTISRVLHCLAPEFYKIWDESDSLFWPLSRRHCTGAPWRTASPNFILTDDAKTHSRVWIHLLDMPLWVARPTFLDCKQLLSTLGTALRYTAHSNILNIHTVSNLLDTSWGMRPSPHDSKNTYFCRRKNGRKCCSVCVFC